MQVARVHQVLREGETHPADQPDRRAATGDLCVDRVTVPDLRRARRDREVRDQDELEAPAHGDAVHGGDDRFAERLDPVEHHAQALQEVVAGTAGTVRNGRVGQRLDVDEVRTRAEGTALPGQHDHPDLRVGLGGVEACGQASDHLGVEPVQGLWPVEPQPQRRAPSLLEDGRSVHQGCHVSPY